ncbi:ATP-dependent helicase [Thermospira aquatica]|uniref:DNA 3'-5' helicase n=1 Tax=Thermospira aquatica TaxID=2828656 RepID=A0AAX3BER1_9SPIR|nr:UvrD-helicase domain-containing protein [Thermospira aquatica]URA10706.1 UvrD-helicase domain-containing protein [Thermospira aquatica]
MDSILENLNERQREAVMATEGAFLVLAGPGSGKTRVITHRFAYLLHTRDIDATNILAVTFTNKAANEMKERIEKLLHKPIGNLWIRTFHSMAYRILRQHAHLLGYGKQWDVIDEGDAVKLMREVVKSLAEKYSPLIVKLYKPEVLLGWISDAKEALKTFDEPLGPKNLPMEHQSYLHDVFKLYQQRLQSASLMDYSDLLANTYVLLRDYEEIRESYQNLWQYIMVDEFQDTNKIQYDIIALLAQKHRNILIVGDDDQSIYGWRGALVKNMRRFEEEFQAKVIKLEQNYRATRRLVEIANKIASAIDDRMGKTLWTENGEGESALVLYGGDEKTLYQTVADTILDLRQKGYNLKDIAIFYRINAQSQGIEEILIQREIPYHIVGSLRFFERREIKDVMAYVAFLVNPLNVLAFERLIEVPPRGIGEVTVSRLVNYAQQNHCDLIEAMKQASSIPGIGPRAKVLMEMAEIFLQLREPVDTVLPATFLRLLLDVIPFEEYWKQQKEEERWENIQALVDAARSFEEANPESTIMDFLNYVVLNTAEEEVKNTDCVWLMTIHNSKGLEFRAVFVLDVVEGLIPLSRSTETPQGLNEERRLFYVAATRAKEKLILCVPEERFAFGETIKTRPSPFLEYLPEDCVEEKKIQRKKEAWEWRKKTDFWLDDFKTAARDTFRKANNEEKKEKVFETSVSGKQARFEDLQPGVRVRHRLMGEGEVVKIVGSRVMIRFDIGAIQFVDKNFLSSMEIL